MPGGFNVRRLACNPSMAIHSFVAMWQVEPQSKDCCKFCHKAAQDFYLAKRFPQKGLVEFYFAANLNFSTPGCRIADAPASSGNEETNAAQDHSSSSSRSFQFKEFISQQLASRRVNMSECIAEHVLYKSLLTIYGEDLQFESLRRDFHDFQLQRGCIVSSDSIAQIQDPRSNCRKPPPSLSLSCVTLPAIRHFLQHFEKSKQV